MSENYLYPQIYIRFKSEELRNKQFSDIIQQSAIVEIDDKIYEIKDQKELSKVNADQANVYFKVIYEPAYNLFLDLERAEIVRDTIIFLPWTKEYIKIESGTNVELLEISGKKVYLFVREGDKIRYNDKIAYILTGKLEVRTYRSPSEGIVIYITSLSEKPVKYLLVVVSEAATRKYKHQ